MSDNTELLRSAAQVLERYFGTDPDAADMEVLKNKLAQVIVDLLLHDMERLLGILYRIDVKEEKVKEAFAQHDPRLIAPRLADLIIGRELQKAVTRSRHKNHGN